MKEQFSEGLQKYIEQTIRVKVHDGLMEPSDGWKLIQELCEAVEFFACEDEDNDNN